MMSNTTAVRPWPTCGDVVDRRSAHVHRQLARLARGRARRCRAASVSRIRIMAGRGYCVGRAAGLSRIRAARRPSTAMPSPRPIGADALAALRLDRHVRAAERTRARFVGHRARGAARGAGCSAAITTSTLTTDQPGVARPGARRRAAARSTTRRGSVSSDAGNSVPRSGRPAGPSSASATAWRDARRRRSGRRGPGPSIVDAAEHERRGSSSPNGWTS